MKEYKYPNSANISTDKENTLIVGERYDYKEGGYIGECMFIADESDDKYWIWKFNWTIAPEGCETENGKDFTCSELKDSKFFYSGMWHIYPVGSYVFPRRPFNKEKFGSA